MPQQRIALTLPAPGGRVRATLDLARWAEQQGYDDVWMSDAAAPDSLTLCAAFASVTETVRVGVAVTPAYTRTPGVFAATAATLGELMPGRFIMGIGSSSQNIVEQWHGIPLAKPVTRVRETTLLIKSILKGEKTNFDGVTVSSHNYRQAPAQQDVPIYLAALRSNMIEMAAEVGDGVIFNLWPRRALPKMLDHVRIGAERAGKNWRDIEIVNRHMVLVTDDVPAGRDFFRAQFGPYYATPVYNQFLAWAGFDDAAAGVREGWAAKDRVKTASSLTDELIDEIGIIGNADYCRDRIRELGAAGVHTHIISALPGPAELQQATREAFVASAFKR